MAHSTSDKFKNYDSSAFPTLHQSILHSKTNPFLVENLSTKISLVIEKELFLVQDPNSPLKEFISYFENDIYEEELPESEYYRPEMTALRVYGSADLWYLILIVNNLFSVTQYRRKTIKLVNTNGVARLTKFMAMADGSARNVNEDENLDNVIF